MKPDIMGKNEYFNEPGISSFSDAELAAIDTANAYQSRTLYPYAYTATVDSSKDERGYDMYQKVIVNLAGVGFGLFLSAEDDIESNLLFNVQMSINFSSDNNLFIIYPFFGLTDLTSVTSSKAAQSNLLDYHKLLNSRHTIIDEQHIIHVNETIECEPRTDSRLYCAGFHIINIAGSDKTCHLRSNISFQKFNTVDNIHRPDNI